jgi:selenocysteine lyase/cysteine desulfurase
VRLYGPDDPQRSTAVISLTIDGLRDSEIGYLLEEHYGILYRVGLHCAPAALRTLGTFPEGTVRLAPGTTTTQEEIDQQVRAITKLA